MAIDKILGNGDLDSVADSVFSAVSNSVSEVKAMQQRKAAENVQLVVESLKKIDNDIRLKFDNVSNALEKRIITIQDGRDGSNGSDGRDGKDGRNGKDGLNGKQGPQGAPGRDGIDGVDGVSVRDAKIDFDGSLIIALSTGQEINVGEVVSPDMAEKIQVISTMSTNGAVGIKDEGSSISTGVKNINFVGASVTATNSGDDVTVNVSAGTGTVTSVAVSGGTTGLTTSGGPITTTGTITLAGTLAVANGGTGVTTSTGSGNNVLSTSPTLVTPLLGTPTSGVATNLTGLPLTTGVTGLLPVANGGTGTATPSLVAGTNVTISGSFPNQTVNATAGGSGDVVGPASSTDNALVRFDSTTGKLIQNSVVIVGDSTGNMSGVGTLSMGGELTYGGVTLSNAVTGTGKMVLDTSPTLVTPLLGTPTSGVATNLTGLPLSTGVTGTLPVGNGGTGATTLAGANIAVVNVANTFTGTQTFSGTSSAKAIVLNDAAEVATVSATAATGTIAYDITTQSVLYYTSDASANWTVNFRGSSGTSLNTLMATGESMTVAFLVTNGATAYYNSAVQVDGTTSGVTTRWFGGAPTAGNASGIDSYRYLIIKTGSATFTVLASNTQFKA